MFRTFLLYCLYGMHLGAVFFMLIGPFLITNTKLLLSIIFMDMMTVTGWYMYGYCLCNDMDNYLTGDESDKPSFIRSIFETATSPVMNAEQSKQFLSLLPLLSTLVCIFNINKTCKKRIKANCYNS